MAAAMSLGPYSRSRIFLLLSIALYLACMPLVGFCVNGTSCSSGLNTLLFGGLGVLYWELSNLIWLANPLLLIAWACLFASKRRSAIFWASLALVVGASFLMVKTVAIDESGVPRPITADGVGYWLWLASIACACLGSVFIAPSRALTDKKSTLTLIL